MERVLKIRQGTRNLQVVIVDLFCVQMDASLKNIHNFLKRRLNNNPDSPHYFIAGILPAMENVKNGRIGSL
jgi:hypothetical protein